jgi:heme oxygenase
MTTTFETDFSAASISAGSVRSEIRQLLRAATHEIHVRLDNHPLLAGITKPDYSMLSYQQVLLGYFYLYRVLEKAISDAIARDALDFDYQARLKLPWLNTDLKFFNIEPLSVGHFWSHGMKPFVIRNAAELVGVLYAIEGSTLGGQVIARQVAKNFGLTSANGGRFFSGYGTQTAERWNAFEIFMQRSCLDADSQYQASGTAVTTFLLVERTLDEYHNQLSTTV